MPPGTPAIGQIVRDARRAAGMTQDVLASAIGCSKPQLSLMENGQRTVSPGRAGAIEQALGITDGYIVAAVQWDLVPKELRGRVEESEDASRRLTSQLRDALASDDPVHAMRRLVDQHASNVEPPLSLTGRIPVINNVAAGYPTEFTDLDYPTSIADEYIACPDVTDPDAFAARVVGDSMEPEYREGEVVVFSPALPTPDGSDCFVRLERDDETTFKRIFFEADDEQLRLQPLNSQYPPKVVHREDIAGMYRAAYVLRKV